MMNVAVMGFGTIGSGVVEILEENKTKIAGRLGAEAEVKYILDLRDFPGTAIEHKIIHDFNVIVQDDEIEVVVETMGGLNPAYPFVKTCLEAGKHVVTSNKALVAAHGTELLAIARERNVNFMFEASVGGGIPIIRTLYQSLAGEEIQEITGILNGTTNFILTKMDKEGECFEDALTKAQELGYAERNPEADVEGHDTCRKIAILTAMATGKEINYEDIHTEGITKITDVDFRYAEKLGCSIKLFGSSQMGKDSVHAWVAPVMIKPSHPLYFVSDVFNGILVRSNMLGETMYYGSGAGKLPTASAVAADIIEALKNKDQNVALGWNDTRQAICPADTGRHHFFLRIAGRFDKMKDVVEAAFGPAEPIVLEYLDEFAVVTPLMSVEQYKAAAKTVRGIRSMIRADFV